MGENTKRHNERRKGPDILVKWVKWAGVITWLLVIPVALLVDKAKPRVETFLDRLLHVKLRETWDYTLIGYAFALMVIVFILSVFSLLVNAARHRRKSDKFSISLILNLIISLIFVIIYITRLLLLSR